MEETLQAYDSQIGPLFLDLSARIQTHAPYKDGSVDGQITFTGFGKYTNEQWQRFFLLAGSFDRWPVAHGQASRKSSHDFRPNGAWWFSVVIRFNIPDGRKWRAMEERYERATGGQWETSTFWRLTREANLALVDVAIWGSNQESIPSLMQQSKYGYKVVAVTLRLHWSPDGERPNWR